jgi:hypothetical protein
MLLKFPEISLQNPDNKKRRLPKEAAFFDLIS